MLSLLSVSLPATSAKSFSMHASSSTRFWWELRGEGAHLNFSRASSMAARASSMESWEPVWIWRFRNFSVSRFKDDLYGGPCRTRNQHQIAHIHTYSVLRLRMLFAHS